MQKSPMFNFSPNYKATIHRVKFTDEERTARVCPESKLIEAIQAFHNDGAVVLENLFPREMISSLHAEYVRRYQHYFKEDLYDDVLHVGNKRMMLQVDIDGVFNDENLYFQPFLAAVLRNLLGNIFIIGGFGSVVSLPGAGAQPVHRDADHLFEGMEGKVVLPPSR